MLGFGGWPGWYGGFCPRTRTFSIFVSIKLHPFKDTAQVIQLELEFWAVVAAVRVMRLAPWRATQTS